jgi:hypothetical protein
MVRAAKLDTDLYQEVKTDTTASWQALLIVVLVSLTMGVGIGIAGFFRMAGVWSLLGLLIGLAFFIITWLFWSLVAYLIGIKILRCQDKSATIGGILRTIGFSLSPGVLGICIFIPVVGGYIWIAVFIWILISVFVAVRQTLNIHTGRAIITYLVSDFTCIAIIFLAVIPLLADLFTGSCAINSRFDNEINTIVKPYRFNIVSWEYSAILHELSVWWDGDDEDIDNATNIVTEYFSATE